MAKAAAKGKKQHKKTIVGKPAHRKAAKVGKKAHKKAIKGGAGLEWLPNMIWKGLAKLGSMYKKSHDEAYSKRKAARREREEREGGFIEVSAY